MRKKIRSGFLWFFFGWALFGTLYGVAKAFQYHPMIAGVSIISFMLFMAGATLPFPSKEKEYVQGREW